MQSSALIEMENESSSDWMRSQREREILYYATERIKDIRSAETQAQNIFANAQSHIHLSSD